MVAPQVNNLPLWCSAMAAGVLGWRAVLAVQGSALPTRRWLVALLVLVAVLLGFAIVSDLLALEVGGCHTHMMPDYAGSVVGDRSARCVLSR